jgi:predicted DsbA family dithiol-disulfide isomerase
LPFQLNPQLPQEGVPRKDYLEQKFGGPERAKEIYARVSSAGRAAGIEFDFERIQIQPNTLNAHRLIHIAGGLGKQDAMVEALFQAYFLEGADLTQIGTLKTLAQRADIDPQAVSDHLASDEDQSMVQDLDREARRMGISGVPFFIFNRRYAVSGAQPPDVLLRTLHQAFTQASLTG